MDSKSGKTDIKPGEMDIKLFASDLDGTLLNGQHRISKKSADTIRRAQRAGKIFIAATGRAWSSVSPIFQSAGLSCGAVLLNGAEYRERDGSVLFREYLSKEDAGRILRILLDDQIDFEMHTDRGDFSTDTGRFRDTRPLSSLSTGYRVMKFFIAGRNLSVIKNQPENKSGIYIASSAPDNIEITASCATKETMLMRAAKWYGITQREVAVFGDGENDMPMLRFFDHSYAVGNAPEDVKRCAAHVIGTNAEDGVARAIQKCISENR